MKLDPLPPEMDPAIKRWAEQLRRLFAATGLSLRELATDLPWAHQSIDRYLQGRRVNDNSWKLALKLIETARARGNASQTDVAELRHIYMQAVQASKSQDRSQERHAPMIDYTTGEILQHLDQRPTPIPQQLPPSLGQFSGRSHEFVELTAALDNSTGEATAVAILTITGPAGVGKTWLALHWAHRHVDRFPDGQLFVDLRGFTPAGEPMSPSFAVTGFLVALGISQAQLPARVDAQVGLYRSLVAGKRILIVLDNALDAEQVVPLLPGSGTCTVLVTSRNRLTGLVTAQGAHSLALDVLDRCASYNLLARRLGLQRLAADPNSVDTLLAGCAGLPLALGIVAGRALAHPDFPLEILAAELRDASTRLGALTNGDAATSLPAVLSWSYSALDSDQARIFRLLGAAPGPDIGVSAAASLTGLHRTRTGSVLEMLERVSLLQQIVPNRYRMHDLVRLYAADRAQHDHAPEDQKQALRRLVDYYLHTAFAADRLLYPHRKAITLDPATPGCQPDSADNENAALEWFDREYPCLLATQRLTAHHGWYRTTWQLAWAMDNFQWRRGHLDDRLTSWRAGLAAADHLSNPTAQCLAHRIVGHLFARAGKHTEALEHLHHALTLAQQTADQFAQAHTNHALAWAWGQRKNNSQALEHATHALHLFQALGQPVLEADAHNAVGWFAAQLGHYTEAQTHCEIALNLFRRHHHRDGEATTLDSLGYIAHHSGRHTHALSQYQQALAMLRDLGNIYLEADTLDRLGHTHATLHHHNQARATWQQAKQLYQSQHRTDDVERVQHQLDNLWAS
jgi:tetratricopeptide (TPR) repeat protein